MKKLASVLMALIVAACLCATAEEASTGNIVAFGHFEQDGDASDGAEPIEWIVLDGDGGTATLISRYALDIRPYNAEQTPVTWESSSLRRWLNEDFLNAAFTEEERARLETAAVTADPNPEWDTDPGADTQDRVFLLSATEADRYFDANEARVLAPTERTAAAGDVQDRCQWWLRSPGWHRNTAAFVGYSGYIDETGYLVDTASVGVRPAIVLNLSEAAPEATRRALQRGDRGDDVARLQRALIEGGWLSGGVDGDFGRMTEAAVKAAQEALGLEPTGVADDAFQRRLLGE